MEYENCAGTKESAHPGPEAQRPLQDTASLAPVRIVREGEKCRYGKNDTEIISFPDIYYDEIRLLFYIVPVLECTVFEDMEERYMNKSDWATILNLWKEINPGKNYNALLIQSSRRRRNMSVRKVYGRELEKLIQAVLRKRKPYSRWMEEWLRDLGGEYDLIWKY